MLNGDPSSPLSPHVGACDADKMLYFQGDTEVPESLLYIRIIGLGK